MRLRPERGQMVPPLAPVEARFTPGAPRGFKVTCADLPLTERRGLLLGQMDKAFPIVLTLAVIVRPTS
ncbi:hypothetical protein ACQP2P_13190 [Dactylosporangium sp. CA-139114]|uniref:hypothetical protein n=1 Tax=Dactylosporangium sp. CA-139114 TaxID=3239931 RepID=UPI003D97B81A